MPLARLTLACVLCVVCLSGAMAADAGDDQYAVAAGHYRQRRWSLAAEAFETFLTQHPDHERALRARFFLGEALMQARRPAEARRWFVEFLDQAPDHRYARQAIFRCGESSYLLGEHESARQYLERFRRRYPDDPLLVHALSYLGDSLLEVDRADEAAEAYRDAIARQSDGPARDQCNFGLAQALERVQQDGAALEIYRALAEKQDGTLADAALFQLAALQYAGGHYTEAIASFEQFVERYPEHRLVPRAQLGRGRARYHLGQYADAAELFAALAHDAEVAVDAAYWLGLVQLTTGRVEQAAETWLGSLDRARGHELEAALRYQAGEALRRTGDAKGAAAQFERVLSEWPTGPWADDALLGRLRVAHAADEHAAVDRLAEVFARAFADSPLHAQAQRIAGRDLLVRGDYEAAIELLAPMVEAAAGGADAATDAHLLAMAYQGAGRHEEALLVLAPLLDDDGAPADTPDAAAAPPSVVDANADAGANEADPRITAARSLLALEKYEEAATRLRAYLVHAPDGQHANWARGHLVVALAQSGQLDAAQTAYEQLAEHVDAAVVVQVASQLAEKALDAGKLDWAAAMFAQVADSEDGSADVANGLAGLAWTYFGQGRMVDAEAACTRLLNGFPEHPQAARAALLRGKIHEQLDQPDGAIGAYQELVERYPDSDAAPEALFAAARLYQSLDRHEQAAQLYEQFVETYPERQEIDAALYAWAWALRDRGDATGADRLFKRLHDGYGESRYWADATFRLAERALEEDRHEAAGGLVDELLARAPDGPIAAHALYLEAQVAAHRGAWGEVAAPLERLIEAYPDSPLRMMAEYWKAEATYRQADYPAAERLFTDLHQRVGGRSEPWVAMVALRRAQSLVQQNRHAEARPVAAAIANDFPEFSQQFEADYVVGRCLAAAGLLDDAREAYRRVIQSPNGNKTETAAMAQWMIGESFMHQKDYTQALREYLRLEILYAYPTWQALALLQAGKCHEMLNQWSDAGELYARLLETYPDSEYRDEASQRLQAISARAEASGR